ncbi:thiamine phosphate synthase [Lachnospiraceae bacterium JLR.KK008]
MKVDYTLYLVTDRSCMRASTLADAVKQAIIGGCTMIQLREKNSFASYFYDLALEIKQVTDYYEVPLIINDRVDIAMAVGAAGVHIGQSDLPAGTVRKIIGREMLLGVSVSSVGQAQKAVNDGADYLGVGAMFPSETKTDAVRVSIEELRQIRRMAQLPIVVIGGICKENVGQFAAMGIDGLAAVSAILMQDNISLAAAELKSLFYLHRSQDL